MRPLLVALDHMWWCECVWRCMLASGSMIETCNHAAYVLCWCCASVHAGVSVAVASPMATLGGACLVWWCVVVLL